MYITMYRYCNLTLRPIAYVDEDTGELHPLYGGSVCIYKDKVYIQSALNMWLRDLSTPKYTVPAYEEPSL